MASGGILDTKQDYKSVPGPVGGSFYSDVGLMAEENAQMGRFDPAMLVAHKATAKARRAAMSPQQKAVLAAKAKARRDQIKAAAARGGLIIKPRAKGDGIAAKIKALPASMKPPRSDKARAASGAAALRLRQLGAQYRSAGNFTPGTWLKMVKGSGNPNSLAKQKKAASLAKKQQYAQYYALLAQKKAGKAQRKYNVMSQLG